MLPLTWSKRQMGAKRSDLNYWWGGRSRQFTPDPAISFSVTQTGGHLILTSSGTMSSALPLRRQVCRRERGLGDGTHFAMPPQPTFTRPQMILKAARMYLGHADEKTTELYTHINKANPEAARALEPVLFGDLLQTVTRNSQSLRPN